MKVEPHQVDQGSLQQLEIFCTLLTHLVLQRSFGCTDEEWHDFVVKRLNYLQTLELLKLKEARPRDVLPVLIPEVPGQQNDDEDSFGMSTRPLTATAPTPSWPLFFDAEMPHWMKEYQEIRRKRGR